MPDYSASCPVCGYEHDFTTKAAMDKAWRGWVRTTRELARIWALPRLARRGEQA